MKTKLFGGLLLIASLISCTSEDPIEQKTSLVSETSLPSEASLTSKTSSKTSFKSTYDLGDIPRDGKDEKGFGRGKWHLTKATDPYSNKKWAIWIVEEVDYWFDSEYRADGAAVTSAEVKKNGIKLGSNGVCYWISTGKRICGHDRIPGVDTF